jgi:hypothetical protein
LPFKFNLQRYNGVFSEKLREAPGGARRGEGVPVQHGQTARGASGRAALRRNVVGPYKLKSSLPVA